MMLFKNTRAHAGLARSISMRLCVCGVGLAHWLPAHGALLEPPAPV